MGQFRKKNSLLHDTTYIIYTYVTENSLSDCLTMYQKSGFKLVTRLRLSVFVLVSEPKANEGSNSDGVLSGILYLAALSKVVRTAIAYVGSVVIWNLQAYSDRWNKCMVKATWGRCPPVAQRPTSHRGNEFELCECCLGLFRT